MLARFITVLLISLFALAEMVLAARDGRVGADRSEGELMVRLSKLEAVGISGLRDIVITLDLESTALKGDLDHEIKFCVFTTTGQYEVTATSLNSTDDKFMVSDNQGNLIEYTADWSDITGLVGKMINGQSITGLGGSATDQACDSARSTNAGVLVHFAEDILLGQIPGVYTDTLTLLIAPV